MLVIVVYDLGETCYAFKELTNKGELCVHAVIVRTMHLCLVFGRLMPIFSEVYPVASGQPYIYTPLFIIIKGIFKRCVALCVPTRMLEQSS
jgi:hypothetical protein